MIFDDSSMTDEPNFFKISLSSGWYKETMAALLALQSWINGCKEKSKRLSPAMITKQEKETS